MNAAVYPDRNKQNASCKEAMVCFDMGDWKNAVIIRVNS